MITEACEEHAIAALAGGAGYAAAAAAGMSERTLRRRLKDPKFLERLALKLKVVSGEIDAGLRALSQQALHVLNRTMQPDQSPALQLRAASLVLPMWFRTRDFELEERVAEVEKIFEEQANTLLTLVDAIQLMRTSVEAPAGQAGEGPAS